MLSEIRYILCTYVLLVVGTMLLINIPVFLIVVNRKALRGPYLVLVVAFLNGGFTGIALISVGLRRIIFTANESLISHHQCVLNVSTFILTMCFVNGMSLLMNSTERLFAVAFPIYYYTHSAQISYSLIAAQYVVGIIATILVVIERLIEPAEQISNFCFMENVYTPRYYSIILHVCNTTSLLSVAVMNCLVMKLSGNTTNPKQRLIIASIKKFGARFLSSHSYNRDLSHFLNNQKQFTQTSIISCFLTICMFLHSDFYEHSFRDTINCATYLPGEFFYKGENHRVVLRAFPYDEFLELGDFIFVSSKRLLFNVSNFFPVGRSHTFNRRHLLALVNEKIKLFCFVIIPHLLSSFYSHLLGQFPGLQFCCGRQQVLQMIINHQHMELEPFNALRQIKLNKCPENDSNKGYSILSFVQKHTKRTKRHVRAETCYTCKKIHSF
uniref:G_PROTEIN_RECEP_F1_2 domain-containing protein n=1 Tax=Elaeophora elaphi TaxID=1147741 RepID=A0A0R3RLX1_9BILA